MGMHALVFSATGEGLSAASSATYIHTCIETGMHVAAGCTKAC